MYLISLAVVVWVVTLAFAAMKAYDAGVEDGKASMIGARYPNSASVLRQEDVQ